LPSTAAPSAGEWNNIGADVILAQKLKRLVRRRYAFMSEGADPLLPCRHAISIIRAAKTSPPRLRRDLALRLRHAYITFIGAESTSEHAMAFRPNYGRDRAERARAARTRSEEKQRKKDEKAELRKAKRTEMNPDESNPPPDETQS
jgi:hypothetical protein